MKFKVEIVEKLSISVEIAALSAEEALEQVVKRYWKEKLIVESYKRPDVEFRVSSLN